MLKTLKDGCGSNCFTAVRRKTTTEWETPGTQCPHKPRHKTVNIKVMSLQCSGVCLQTKQKYRFSWLSDRRLNYWSASSQLDKVTSQLIRHLVNMFQRLKETPRKLGVTMSFSCRASQRVVIVLNGRPIPPLSVAWRMNLLALMVFILHLRRWKSWTQHKNRDGLPLMFVSQWSKTVVWTQQLCISIVGYSDSSFSPRLWPLLKPAVKNQQLLLIVHEP